MCADADEKRKDPRQVYNHNVKCLLLRLSTIYIHRSSWLMSLIANFLQRPPVTEEHLLFKDIYYNPFVLQLANA